ncbi:H-NS family histone-like protein [Candidatus Enterovibrio escicola]|uniref:DNA-binding protein n=2 Tax=Candidatus Enterovibrio escicola TaxID=1927127 RepID=A0A2A5T1Q9_9GAMM|nr:H-NS family nucleoid-associated regulatory protein [Candidatus Enterovibrio escacola]PCS22086.1 DNA-binding protein H-NS [Candidatus Enterovibrio escacola]
MSDTLKVLLNLRSLRAVVRELTQAQLQEALEKLQTVVSEREEAYTKAHEAETERMEKMVKYREMMINDGIDPEELLTSLRGTKPKLKRVTRPAKYKYIDIDGSKKTWTGQGRTPKIIRDSLEDGKKIEDFLI